MELLDYVPPIFHGFYQQLQGGNSHDSAEEMSPDSDEE